MYVTRVLLDDRRIDVSERRATERAVADRVREMLERSIPATRLPGAGGWSGWTLVELDAGAGAEVERAMSIARATDSLYSIRVWDSREGDHVLVDPYCLEEDEVPVFFGQPGATVRRWCVSLDLAWPAIEYFIVKGERFPGVTWEPA